MTAPEKTQGGRWPVGSVWAEPNPLPNIIPGKYVNHRVILAHAPDRILWVSQSDSFFEATVKTSTVRGFELYERMGAVRIDDQATRADAAEGGKP